MITICLDESGNFEDEKYTKPLIIGGLMYTGDDFLQEEKRIENFYIDLCKELNIEYPNDIHSTDNNPTLNEKITEGVINYLKEHEKYYFTAMIKYNNSNEKSKDERISNIADTSYGGNLYENMATKFIYNNIFYNPDLINKNNMVNLRLATRSSQLYKDKDKILIEQFDKLGYDKNDYGDSYRYYLTKAATFKTALATKIYESNYDKKIQFDLKVESINYKKESTTSPFLFFADNVCEIIKRETRSMNYASNMEKLNNLLRKKVNRDFYCFAYDDIDLIWTKVMQSIKDKDLIKALHNIAKMTYSDSNNKKYYLSFWLPKTKEIIKDIFDVNMIDSYIANLDYYFSKDKSEYDIGMFIAERLLEIIEEKNIRNSDYIKYKIYEKIAIANNHRGDIATAIEYFEKIKNLINNGCNVNMLDIINLKNREIELYENSFDYEKSLASLLELKPNVEKIEDTFFDIAINLDINNDKSYYIREKGKILSHIGQVYGFLNNKEEAERYFYEALELFNMKNDKKVTRSYLKHLYIENKEREKYEKLMIEDYNTSDYKELMSIIFKNQDRFELFYYVKSLNMLYADDIDDNFVKNIIKELNKNILSDSILPHPVELIIKHIALLCVKKNMVSQAEELLKYLKKMMNMGFTVNVIICKCYIDVYRLKRNKLQHNEEAKIKAQNKLIKEQLEDVEKYFEGEENTIKVQLKNTANIDEKINVLDRIVTYTYN